MKAFDYSLVKDPQYFCDNRMEAHSDHVYYRDGNEMQTAVQDGTETSFRYSLNGLWKFHYARNYKSAVQGFEKEDYCCYDWDDIHVPAHIQMEGYDAPQYANVQYPWEGHEEIYPGQIPERFNPVASYVKYFTVPEHMKGKRLAGAKIRTSSVSPEFTEMCIFIQFRILMHMIFRSVQSRKRIWM